MASRLADVAGVAFVGRLRFCDLLFETVVALCLVLGILGGLILLPGMDATAIA